MISIGEIRAVNAFTTPAMPEANAAAEVHPEQGAPIEQNSTLPAASSETAIQRTWWQRIRGIDPRPIAERAPGNINIICYYYQSAELRLELRANHEVFPTWQHLLYPLTRPTGVEELFRMILDDRSLTPRNRATRKNLESVRQNRTSWIETIRASHNNGALFPSAQYTTSDGTHSSIVSAREERGGIHLIPEAIDTQDSERIFIRQPPPASYDFSLVNLEQGLHEHLTPVIDYEIAEIQINQRDTIEVSMAEPATTDTARVHEERLFFEIPQQGTRDAPLYTTPIPRLSSSGDPYNGRPAGNSHPLSGRVGNGSGETSGGMQFAPEPLFRSRSRSFPKISEILWGTALYRATKLISY